MKSRLILVFTLAVLLPLQAAPALHAAEEAAPQKIVVTLKHFTDDLHAAMMALKLARGLGEAGADVTLFLNLEGVRLADLRQPQAMAWGMTPDLSAIYQGFVEAGGRVLVCPHCAAAAGMEAADLRPGSVIAAEGDVVKVLLEAEKILDY